MSAPATIRFDGPCPFLFCLEEGVHHHPVCPDCDAVNWGNLFCGTCQRNASEYRERLLEQLYENPPEVLP